MVGRAEHRRRLKRRVAAIGVVEQPEPLLDREHASDGAVERLHHRRIVPRAPLELGGVEAAVHVHVDPGAERERRRVGIAARDAMGAKLGNAVPVADHEARPVPGPAKGAGQEVAIGMGGDAPDRVEGRHE